MVCGMTYPDKDFHIDHIIPKSKFPCSHPWNLQLLCSHCNIKKGSKLLDMIPIFLNGEKYRTDKYFNKDDDTMNNFIYWANYRYQTSRIINDEEIIKSIINDFDSWVDIIDYLGNM